MCVRTEINMHFYPSLCAVCGLQFLSRLREAHLRFFTEPNLGRYGFVPGCSERPTEAGGNLRSVNVASVIGNSGLGIEIISVDISYPVLEVLRKEGLECGIDWRHR